MIRTPRRQNGTGQGFNRHAALGQDGLNRGQFLVELQFGRAEILVVSGLAKVLGGLDHTDTARGFSDVDDPLGKVLLIGVRRLFVARHLEAHRGHFLENPLQRLEHARHVIGQVGLSTTLAEHLGQLFLDRLGDACDVLGHAFGGRGVIGLGGRHEFAQRLGPIVQPHLFGSIGEAIDLAPRDLERRLGGIARRLDQRGQLVHGVIHHVREDLAVTRFLKAAGFRRRGRDGLNHGSHATGATTVDGHHLRTVALGGFGGRFRLGFVFGNRDAFALVLKDIVIVVTAARAVIVGGQFAQHAERIHQTRGGGCGGLGGRVITGGLFGLFGGLFSGCVVGRLGLFRLILGGLCRRGGFFGLRDFLTGATRDRRLELIVQIFGRCGIHVRAVGGGFLQHVAQHVARIEQHLKDALIQRHAIVTHQTDQVLGKVGAAFDHGQAQNPRVPLERVNRTEKGTDMFRLIPFAILKRQQRLFHRVEGLAAIICEKGPDFVHFVRHRLRCLSVRSHVPRGVFQIPHLWGADDQAAIKDRMTRVSSSPVFSCKSWDTVPDGFATTPSAPSSRALAAWGEPDTVTEDNMQILARVRSLAWRRNSNPSITGISMSKRIRSTSGFSSSLSNASWPLFACAIMVKSGSVLRKLEIYSRIIAASSTTITL